MFPDSVSKPLVLSHLSTSAHIASRKFRRTGTTADRLMTKTESPIFCIIKKHLQFGFLQLNCRHSLFEPNV